MLTLNLLLQSAGIAPEHTRLARHKGNGINGRTAFDLWLAKNGSFERYQSIQSKERFDVGEWLASFVVSRIGETIFAGLYKVLAIGPMDDPDAKDPLGDHSVAECHLYTLERQEVLSDLEGRLVIDWGPGALSWVQRADRQNKTIVELRRKAMDPPYPGHDLFKHQIRHLAEVPHDWRTTLTFVCGVYLLVCLKDGKQYVGSASGQDGFWGRWSSYATNGHGGNEGMRLVVGEDYQVSILEVAAGTAQVDDILRLEQKWKEKLLSKQYGLNWN